jgi:hypothetical protein
MEGFFMPKEPDDLNQQSKPNLDGLSASEADKLADATGKKETVWDRVAREIAQNPTWTEAKPTGQGFVIVGSRPSAGKPDDRQPSEPPRYIATVPAEPTFMLIDPNRPSVPAPVPMGPYRKDTEQLIGYCVAAHPGLTREETIEALWEAGGI